MQCVVPYRRPENGRHAQAEAEALLRNVNRMLRRQGVRLDRSGRVLVHTSSDLELRDAVMLTGSVLHGATRAASAA